MPLRALVPETSASANSATSAAACAPTPIFGYGRHERNQHKAGARHVNRRSRRRWTYRAVEARGESDDYGGQGVGPAKG
jgi:hypothetical protein